MKAYEIIYQAIENSILRGEFLPGDFLPSENQYVKQFKVSRDTVRKALNLLMTNGYIQKIHGKGSMVLKREQLRFPISGLTSYKELQHAYGYNSLTKVVFIDKIMIDTELEKMTGFATGEMVWKMIRTREIDGQKVILDTDYLLCRLIPNMSIDIGEDSIYKYIEKNLNLQISFAEKEIRVVKLNTAEKEFLDLTSQDINIVSIQSRVFLANTEQFQYTDSRHRVDKFLFYDFARRNPSTI
ncbi:trehalose operon repressor [Vagococcus sp. JNUCC 83]